MKATFYVLLLCITILLGCEKEKFASTGIITGQDFALCACCGGYFIDIEDVSYRFEKSVLPSDFTFTDSQLPLTVELDWKLRNTACSDFNWIAISKIRVK